MGQKAAAAAAVAAHSLSTQGPGVDEAAPSPPVAPVTPPVDDDDKVEVPLLLELEPAAPAPVEPDPVEEPDPDEPD